MIKLELIAIIEKALNKYLADSGIEITDTIPTVEI